MIMEVEANEQWREKWSVARSGLAGQWSEGDAAWAWVIVRDNNLGFWIENRQ
jgi:hypothetical protein